MSDRLKLILAAAGMFALAACGGQGDDKAAEQVEQAFENKAEALEQAAENASGAVEESLEDQAEIYRRTGEAAAEAVDDVDLNAEAGGQAGGNAQ